MEIAMYVVVAKKYISFNLLKVFYVNYVEEIMEEKILRINKNKSGSGSISNRIVLPSAWVKDMQLEGEVIAYYDEENKKIILEKMLDNKEN